MNTLTIKFASIDPLINLIDRIKNVSESVALVLEENTMLTRMHTIDKGFLKCSSIDLDQFATLSEEIKDPIILPFIDADRLIKNIKLVDSNGIDFIIKWEKIGKDNIAESVTVKSDSLKIQISCCEMKYVQTHMSPEMYERATQGIPNISGIEISSNTIKKLQSLFPIDSKKESINIKYDKESKQLIAFNEKYSFTIAQTDKEVLDTVVKIKKAHFLLIGSERCELVFGDTRMQVDSYESSTKSVIGYLNDDID